MKQEHCGIVRAGSRPAGPHRSVDHRLGRGLDGISATPRVGQSAVWLPQGATTGNIYYNGNVGIGTAPTQGKLQVAGVAVLA